MGVARDRDKPRDSIPFGIEKIRDISFAHNNFNSRTNSSDDALNMKDRRWKNWAVRDSGFSMNLLVGLLGGSTCCGGIGASLKFVGKKMREEILVSSGEICVVYENERYNL